MSQETSGIFDVIIIGAGQAGLSAGYFLNERELNYVIFERGSIAESWQSQRWDSLRLDTPGWMNFLPGESSGSITGELFMKGREYCEKLKRYTYANNIPVREYHRVTSLDKDDNSGLFHIETDHNGEMEIWLAKNVIVASGMLNEPKIPAISSELPSGIKQFHTADYHNPDQLPPGNTLIVGSAKSGCQIAEELSATAHKVYLATSKVGRSPRRYRGADVMEWLVRAGFLELATAAVPDPAMISATVPVISGVGPLGHTLSLQLLHHQGVKLMGRLQGAADGKLLFARDAAENIRFADEVSLNVKRMVDDYIEKNGILAEITETDIADEPDPEGSCAALETELDMADHQITSLIWATGFRGGFGWLKLPVFDHESKIVHDDGASQVKGLFFLGFPWLRTRKSGVIFGVSDDAASIVGRIPAI
ncbi:flavin-containing monooxygenase [Pedobacter hartonius]|uniref:Putative flavoprotein involved in K+ transport n=1 Tax=Pedobacter hartonius TaxID=425514 RepID=A0A1H4GP82_9SPHI|nr:NAD(P)/FAD-dependent oxidoreductase [Pedobacter hartonius]SEB10432.1 putative flavoprotein involved in K+ transport [Pedobacter hartonius]